jgi:hypothetical protein
MTSRGPALALLVCLFGAAPAARVARAADKATDANADTPAAQLIADAVTEYDAGRYDEARALFRLAHQKAPTARTLRGIGMASFELRDYVEAARSLAGALRDERRPLTDEQHKQVEGLLARAETFVGRFSLRIQPASHDLLVDGQPTALEPDGSLLLGFGHHRITARCPACTPTEKTVEVEVLGGEHREIEIAFAPAAPPPAADLSPRAGGLTISAGDQPPPAASAGRDVTPWYWAGAAAVGLVGATAGALWWSNRGSELDICRAAGDRCQNESTVSTERDVAIGLTVGMAAGAVASGVVAALLWHRHDPASGVVACLSGKGTVSCAIRF